MKSKTAAFFMILAGIGFIVSLVTHIASSIGLSVFPQEPLFLHIGIFVVGLPASLCSQSLAKEFPQKQIWKAALRGCPKYMQYIFYGLLAYAFLNFAFLASAASNHSPSAPATIQGSSGYWLLFYYAAFAILYSYIQVQKQDPLRHCQNGHVVAITAKFCPECGVSVGNVFTDKS